jgi:hypothetical protein
MWVVPLMDHLTRENFDTKFSTIDAGRCSAVHAGGA